MNHNAWPGGWGVVDSFASDTLLACMITTPSGFACHPSDGGEFSSPHVLLDSPPLEGCPEGAGWLKSTAGKSILYHRFFRVLERIELLVLFGHDSFASSDALRRSSSAEIRTTFPFSTITILVFV